MSNSLTLAPAPRSEAAEQVREEVREFLAAELAAGTFEMHVDTWLSGVDPAFSRKLGERCGSRNWTSSIATEAATPSAQAAAVTNM